MDFKEYTKEDKETLGRLNEAVRIACEARRQWLDDNMAKYSDFKVGDEVYDIERGTVVGIVTAIRRWHRDDIRHDDSLDSYVEFEDLSTARNPKSNYRSIRNTSSEHGLGTKEQALRHAKMRMSRLRMAG